MSGGYFDYDNSKIDRVTEEIQELIDNNLSEEINDYGGTVGKFYNHTIMKTFVETVKILREASLRAHRIDYLLSGDDGEDNYLSRLYSELKEFQSLN